MSNIINEICNTLTTHKDQRVKDLLNGEIDATKMAVLFSSHFDPNIKIDNFRIDYLAPGLSGAGIVLITPEKGLSYIIKYGKVELINKEKENYDKIKDYIPNMLPPLKGLGKELQKYNSIAYSWAGGWEDVKNIREYFKSPSTKLYDAVKILLDNLFQWHKIKPGTENPFDQWEWEQGVVKRIKEKIRDWDGDSEDKKSLSSILDDQGVWRDALRLKKFSIGNYHGDLNYRNILIVQEGENISPKLIDFASIGKDKSPAKDWAKMEREIKFRFMSDIMSDEKMFRKTLKELETACDDLKPFSTKVSHLIEAQRLISLIRKEYSSKTTNISDAPHLEYLFFLFYTTLAYSIHDDIQKNPTMQNAVIDSACRIHQKIEQLLNTNLGYKYPGITGFELIPQSTATTDEPIKTKQPLSIPPAYKNWISMRCKKMDIDKLVDSKDTELISLTLPEIFIPLYATPPGENTKQKKEISEKEHTAVDIEKLIADNDYLLIQGQAGSGKTTLLKHLAYTIVNETNEAGFEGFLPVLIFLRDLPMIKMEHGITGTGAAERLLSAYFQAANNELTLELIKAYCQKRRAIFLIDGLDEIEPELRKVVVESLAALRMDYNCNKMALSGRPHGIDTAVYDQFGKKLVEINSLNLNQVKLFIEKWCLFDVELQVKGKTIDSMFGEIKDHPNVEELIITPLMLTAACVLYHYDKKLPEQRAELYKKVIDNLISKRFKDKATVVLKFLMKLAFEVHTTKQREPDKDFDTSKIGFDHVLALRVMAEVFERGKEETDTQYALRLRKEFDNIEQNCGLLRLENGQYRFWHLTFQEFLMAWEIVMFEGNHAQVINEKYWDNDWFKEMLELLIGHLSNTANAIAIGIIKDKLKVPDSSPFRNWRLACNCLLDIHPRLRDTNVVKLAQSCLRSIFEQELEQDPKILAEAGEILGWLGDSRRDLKEFVEIEGDDNLEGLGKKTIKTFEIGKYPVTNQWYKEFIDANGYEKPEYWSPNGQAWLRQQQDKFPKYWHERKWKCPNAPVVGVCWYEADAFCQWLTEVSNDRYTYRLPTEKEWQAAAAGKEGREYAWGDWQENRCNYAGANIGKTSAVGIFLKGCTPEGVADLCGNVWEWTDSWYDKSDGSRLLRGGSWYDVDPRRFRGGYRYYYDPDARRVDCGFRASRTVTT